MSVSLYEFSSRMGKRNRLVTPSIGDRDGMEGRGEGKRANEVNGGREWLSTAAMTVDGGVAVYLRLCFMAFSIKK